jgi:hypothetical protein
MANVCSNLYISFAASIGTANFLPPLPACQTRPVVTASVIPTCASVELTATYCTLPVSTTSSSSSSVSPELTFFCLPYHHTEDGILLELPALRT